MSDEKRERKREKNWAPSVFQCVTKFMVLMGKQTNAQTTVSHSSNRRHGARTKYRPNMWNRLNKSIVSRNIAQQMIRAHLLTRNALCVFSWPNIVNGNNSTACANRGHHMHKHTIGIGKLSLYSLIRVCVVLPSPLFMLTVLMHKECERCDQGDIVDRNIAGDNWVDRNESGFEIYFIVGPFRAVPADDNGPILGGPRTQCTWKHAVAWATRSIDWNLWSMDAFNDLTFNCPIYFPLTGACFFNWWVRCHLLACTLSLLLSFSTSLRAFRTL